MDVSSSRLRPLAAVVGLAFAVVVGAACSRTVQTQAGSSLEERAPAASSQPAKPEAAPSLSVSADQRKNPDSEVIIAKADSSNRPDLDELRRDQLATTKASLEDVFFDYDRWSVGDRGHKVLQANAGWLRANPGKTLTIQGHCDERGTSAYNMVLGEKRAKSIRTYLIDLGISADRLRIVSYGKERPFCQESSEGCHQKNRRAHLVVEAP